MLRVVAFILSVAIAMQPVRALAQETPPPSSQFQLPDPGNVLPLHRGTAAPRDGLLIDADNLLSIQQSYDRMRYMLDHITERDQQVCDARVQIEQARTTAASATTSLHDELWTQRQTELQQALAQAQARAERQWWESEALWFALGGLVVAGVIAVVATVR